MVDSIFKKVISYILIASVFITGSSFAEVPFSVFWFLPVYILFLSYSLIAYRKININVLFGIVALSVYSLATMKSNPEMIVKQLINIVFTVLVFYNFIVHENFDIREILRKYIQVAKIILVIGFAQVFLFLAGLREVYLAIFPFLRHTNISERFQSISDEPSFIALTFIPVVFVALHNFFYGTRYFIGRVWSSLFIAGYLLTLSSAAFIALLMMVLIIYLKKITIIKGVLAAVFCMFVFLAAAVSYNRIDYIRVRVDDTLFGLNNDFLNPVTYESVNLSTYAFLSNAYVTKKTLEDFPVTGRGLGTHEVSYDLHLPKQMKDYSQLNRKDANSLGLRLLSETGIIGASFFLVFLFGFRVNKKKGHAPEDDVLWILNMAIFVTLTIILLRHGNYTSSGKMLFVLLYFYSYKYYSRTNPSAIPTSAAP